MLVRYSALPYNIEHRGCFLEGRKATDLPRCFPRRGKRAIFGFVVHEVFKEPPHVGLVDFLHEFLPFPVFETPVPRLELPQIVPMGFFRGLCAHQCVEVAVDCCGNRNAGFWESGVLNSGTILVLDEPFLVGFDPEGIAEGRARLRMPFLVFPLVPRNVELPSTVIFEVQRAIGFELWHRDRAISPFLLNFHSLVDFYGLVCQATCTTQPNTQGRSDFKNPGKVVTK